jgi:hypothetical protein
VRAAAELPSLEACLERDYGVSCAFLDTPDFSEGIRAMVVDKDRRPAWDPPTTAAVDDQRVERFFATGDESVLAPPA